MELFDKRHNPSEASKAPQSTQGPLEEKRGLWDCMVSGSAGQVLIICWLVPSECQLKEYQVHYFPIVAATRCHQLRDLKQHRFIISHFWKSEV